MQLCSVWKAFVAAELVNPGHTLCGEPVCIVFADISKLVCFHQQMVSVGSPIPDFRERCRCGVLAKAFPGQEADVQ